MTAIQGLYSVGVVCPPAAEPFPCTTAAMGVRRCSLGVGGAI